MVTRFRIRSLAAGLSLAVVAVGSAAATVPAPAADRREEEPTAAWCTAAAFSPAYAKDGTAFCYWFVFGPAASLYFFVTTDGMRTWQRTPAVGFVPRPGTAMGQLFVSPLFETDRTVYLHTSDQGLFASTDLGQTFQVADPLVTTYGRESLTATVSTDLLGRRGTAIAYADPYQDLPGLFEPPLHRPVAGSPDSEVRFLFSPAFTTDGTAFVLAERPPDQDAGGPWWRGSLYSCTAQLVCLTKLHEFPNGQTVTTAWVAPDFATSRRLFVKTTDRGRQQRLWVSTDGGRRFVEDRTVVDVSRRIVAAGGSGLRIDVGFLGTRQAFLHLAYVPSAPRTRTAGAPPANQVFRSDDGGRTWRLASYGRARSQAGPRGTIPWTHLTGDSTSSTRLQAPAPGLLVTLAGNEVTQTGGFYCSRDLGRTWRLGCR